VRIEFERVEFGTESASESGSETVEFGSGRRSGRGREEEEEEAEEEEEEEEEEESTDGNEIASGKTEFE